MLNRLADFLVGRSMPVIGGTAAEDEMHLAVAALLIEAARMDSTFDVAERASIEALLATKFNLDGVAVRQLIDDAQRKVEDSTQYFPFTNAISKNMTIEQRTEIIEMMWSVAYSDGVLDPHEDMLLRQVAGLLHVPDRERGLARQRALAAAAARTS
jgi:uncharacterized tellurite resistance protein B-like protein